MPEINIINVGTALTTQEQSTSEQKKRKQCIHHDFICGQKKSVLRVTGLNILSHYFFCMKKINLMHSERHFAFQNAKSSMV